MSLALFFINHIEFYDKESFLIAGLRGNLKMAGDTLARSQSIGIPISADAMKIYLDLRDFNQKKRESSIFYNISELFKSSSSDNKK